MNNIINLMESAENLINEHGWQDVIIALHAVASKQGHNELALELENLAINYVPEVR